MKGYRSLTAAALIAFATSAWGEGQGMHELATAQSNWEFISDQVMGGVSEGSVVREGSGDETTLRLKGTVSTKNNGGFLQARLELPDGLPASAQGVVLEVRGNSQKYYLHARTRGTVLPWNFYQASYEVSQDWQALRIPFTAFHAEGRLLRKALAPERIKSLAIVAYGRDHEADLSLRAIGYY